MLLVLFYFFFQAKQQHNNHKGQEKGKKNGMCYLVQEALYQTLEERPSGSFSFMPVGLTIQKTGILVDIADVSGTVNDVADMVQHDFDDRDASPKLGTGVSELRLSPIHFHLAEFPNLNLERLLPSSPPLLPVVFVLLCRSKLSLSSCWNHHDSWWSIHCAPKNWWPFCLLLSHFPSPSNARDWDPCWFPFVGETWDGHNQSCSPVDSNTSILFSSLGFNCLFYFHEEGSALGNFCLLQFRSWHPGSNQDVFSVCHQVHDNSGDVTQQAHTITKSCQSMVHSSLDRDNIIPAVGMGQPVGRRPVLGHR